MTDINVHTNVSLAPYTTLKVGGPAEYFTEVRTTEELTSAVAWAHEHDRPITVLGGGSNVLISDDGISGLVIRDMIDTLEVEERGDDEVVVTAGAGITFDALVAQSVHSGWWGLENLSAIPGFVGATPVQNVGAYGVEVKDLIEWVEVCDVRTNTVHSMQNDACEFSYRGSFFKTDEGRNYIITRVSFVLHKTPHRILSYRDLKEWFANTTEAPSQDAIRAAVMRIRMRKFPDWHQTGTAGSFFKNPIITKDTYDALKKTHPDLPGFDTDHGDVKVPLAWILDHILDIKGTNEGAVGTYKGQALVIVHNGGATAREIAEYAEHIQQRVRDTLGIAVEWEVTRLGEL